MTTLILWILHFIPGMRLRCDEETEILGIDDKEMGEYAYDYVGIDAELGVGLPHGASGPGGVGGMHALGTVGGGREPHHTDASYHHHRDSSSERVEKVGA